MLKTKFSIPKHTTSRNRGYTSTDRVIAHGWNWLFHTVYLTVSTRGWGWAGPSQTICPPVCDEVNFRTRFAYLTRVRCLNLSHTILDHPVVCVGWRSETFWDNRLLYFLHHWRLFKVNCLLFWHCQPCSDITYIASTCTLSYTCNTHAWFHQNTEANLNYIWLYISYTICIQEFQHRFISDLISLQHERDIHKVGK